MPALFRVHVVAGLLHISNISDKGKYPHWVNEDLPDKASEWLAHAQQAEGSWWNDWHAWLSEKSGGKKKAPKVGGKKKYPVLEDAPGKYVKKRLDAVQTDIRLVFMTSL
eukprot:TRINITY_DN97713_c0_g1_i1.p1 TRINITY_DN97713_c0_g1~~TRINITY_DN97713_c0_g1_i1.p1  ORF type:complete len:109 (+),score=10.42 TRINITY_DN97713_c0_g1_i1:2-328(+)